MLSAGKYFLMIHICCRLYKTNGTKDFKHLAPFIFAVHLVSSKLYQTMKLILYGILLYFGLSFLNKYDLSTMSILNQLPSAIKSDSIVFALKLKRIFNDLDNLLKEEEWNMFTGHYHGDTCPASFT